MTDTFDLARPIRDAAIAEIKRLVGGGEIEKDAMDANVLGVHLSAVLLAFTADRHKQTGGVIRDENLHLLLTAAIGQMITNAAMALRPVANGQPVPPHQVALFLLQRIFAETMHQVGLNENGLQDFVIPFQRTEDGGLEVKSFDFNDHLKGA